MRNDYFPTSGMSSVVGVKDEERVVEEVTVSNEGMIGIPALLGPDFSPSTAISQNAGKALRMPASAASRRLRPRLPMAADSFSAKPEPETAGHGRPVRVLVVDDYPDNAASMAMLLRLYGHEVDIALNGCEALRKAQAKPPDVVLLDISMPGMSGYRVARELRSLFQQRVRLIAITAHSFAEDQQRCLEVGFDLHLVKPADPREVQRLLEQLAEVLRVAGRL
jgi:CheY-like chemotaxis protein